MDLDEIWDNLVDEFEYVISFEWLSDIGEFFSGLFENMSEFSLIGSIYGIVMVALITIFRKSVFVFVDSMNPAYRIILYPVCYIFAFAIGYIMGKRIWDN